MTIPPENAPMRQNFPIIKKEAKLSSFSRKENYLGRDLADSTLNLSKLGKRIRGIRQQRQWTLEEAGRRSRLATSTWSKIEKGQMSPTFDVLLKLASGLEIHVGDLFRLASSTEANGRRSITRAGTGPVHASPTYDYEVLSSDLANKKMLPLRTRIRARHLAEFTKLTQHQGEEFVYVVSGRVVLHTEFYEPTELSPGDSAYFDSTMPHALVASEGDPVVIWVTTDETRNFPRGDNSK